MDLSESLQAAILLLKEAQAKSFQENMQFTNVLEHIREAQVAARRAYQIALQKGGSA